MPLKNPYHKYPLVPKKYKKMGIPTGTFHPQTERGGRSERQRDGLVPELQSINCQ